MKPLFLSLLMLAPTLANAQSLHIVGVGVDCNFEKSKPDPWGMGMKRLVETVEEFSKIPVKKTLVTGKHATKANVLDALEELKPKDNDIVFIYFGTHGGIQKKKDRFYLCLYGSDCIYGSEIARIVNGLSCKVVVAIDACHSAAILDSPMPKALVLCSCKKEQFSYGNTFIKAMGDGYKGAADLDKNGEVTFLEMVIYLPAFCNAKAQHMVTQLPLEWTNGLEKLATSK